MICNDVIKIDQQVAEHDEERGRGRDFDDSAFTVMTPVSVQHGNGVRACLG
jgi:hypothetical protein